MADIDLTNAILACIENGDRLTDDATLALDFERTPTAYALSVLAQEEYAKALLLLLVEVGALPWSPEVRGALRDHLCKQLATVLLDYLCPQVDEFIRRHNGMNIWEDLPKDVLDAIHVIVHERIPKERGRWWIAPNERPLDKTVKKIAQGTMDRKKQDAVYVDIGETGKVESVPLGVSVQAAEAELERAKRIGGDLRPGASEAKPRLPPHVDSGKLVDIFRLLTNQLSPTEFTARWRSV